jgi:CRISPR-associated exonuclease Cas4
MAYVIVACTLLGLIFIWTASRQRRAAGLPRGRVLAIDIHDRETYERTLYDPVLDLTGRPDYVIEHKGELVPVEAKSRRAPPQPYPSHVLQLAAYCRLVEVEYRRRPPYGVVKYRDRSIAVGYTAGLEASLRQILAEMRQRQGAAPDRSHASVERCTSCGYRETCDQALA